MGARFPAGKSALTLWHLRAACRFTTRPLHELSVVSLTEWLISPIIYRRSRRKPDTNGSPVMNEEAFNLSVRKFLKSFGLNAQHEIEQAVEKALARNAVAGTDKFPAKITLQIDRLNLSVEFKGEIALG
jgi:hypothetical protein